MKNMIYVAILTLLITPAAHAQSCPSGDDPAIIQKVSDKTQLILCGFEDHDFPEAEGQRAFSDFKVFLIGGTKPVQAYSSEEGETQLAKGIEKGINLVDIWEVGDQSVPATSRDLLCDDKGCKLQEPKCVLKVPKNPFPTALSDLEASMKKGKLKPEAEQLVDKVFAQALGGDKAANKFFASAKKPKGFEGANAEAWDEAHKRTQLAQKLKCQ